LTGLNTSFVHGVNLVNFVLRIKNFLLACHTYCLV
jgi:hypothetical protein